MAWEIVGDAFYGGPAASAKDRVRFEVGDTDRTEWLVSDAEIAYALTTYSNDSLQAAAAIADHIAARFSREADKTVSVPGGTSTTHALSQRARSFLALAARLRERSALTGSAGVASCYGGGLSEDEKDTDAADTDLVQPAFQSGMFDTLDTNSQSPRRYRDTA